MLMTGDHAGQANGSQKAAGAAGAGKQTSPAYREALGSGELHPPFGYGDAASRPAYTRAAFSGQPEEQRAKRPKKSQRPSPAYRDKHKPAMLSRDCSPGDKGFPLPWMPFLCHLISPLLLLLHSSTPRLFFLPPPPSDAAKRKDDAVRQDKSQLLQLKDMGMPAVSICPLVTTVFPCKNA